MAKVSKKANKVDGSARRAAMLADLTRAVALVEEAAALIAPHVTVLSPDARKVSLGKLRVGESEVLRGVLDAAEKYPALVAGHGDGGVDPQRFEAEILRDWLTLHERFAEAAAQVDAVSDQMVSRLSDSALFYGAKSRKPTLRVYNDLSVLAKSNPELRRELQEPLAYFGGFGRKAKREKKPAKG